MENIFVVMPAYNEAAVLPLVLEDVCKNIHPQQIILVNDGSGDQTKTIAKQFGVHVLSHKVNRGLGAALKSGIILSVALGADAIVTFDSDGQHKAKDIKKITEPIKLGEADMVIGSRFLQNQSMPFHRKIFNWIGNFVTWVFYGKWVSDSQSGLRAFTSDVAQKMNIKANHMEVSSEFINEAQRLGLRLSEISIEPVYTEYSLSKGQSFVGGVKTLTKIALRKFLV